MKHKGLGDTIKWITNWLGITQCAKCKERQVYFNKLIPYKNNKNKMNQETKEAIEHLITDKPTKIECKALNEIRKNHDGVWSDSCFCTLSQRKAFVKEFKEWYENIL